MIGDPSMSDRRARRRGRSAPPRHVVVLENIDAVGMALALSLLEAGYEVVGRNVAPNCVEEFQAAGGITAANGGQTARVAWSIECHQRPGVHPETLSRLVARRQGFGRPRLELSGLGRVAKGAAQDRVATLAIRSGREPDTAIDSILHVALDVSPRGLHLVVHGERPLFEAALPILTVLADRVLYAGLEPGDYEQASGGFPGHN